MSKRRLSGAKHWLRAIMHRLIRNRDFFAGILLVLIGLVAATVAPGYGIGTPMRMQPGFFPTALGAVMILLGVAVAVAGLTESLAEQEDALSALPKKIEWRGWICILSGPIAFVVLGEPFGLMPAAFGCVFISALGDRKSTVKSALVLAACVSVLGALVFSVLLGVPLPVLAWRP